jgi:hypothetical protein
VRLSLDLVSLLSCLTAKVLQKNQRQRTEAGRKTVPDDEDSFDKLHQLWPIADETNRSKARIRIVFMKAKGSCAQP